MAFIFWLFFGLAVAYGLQWLAWNKQRASNDARKAATSLGLPRSRLQDYVRLTQKRPAEDLKKKVAKSEEPERAVWSLVEYIIRDYIEWWYNKISRDNDFTNDVRHMFEHVLSQIVDGLKKVQWETVIENLMVEMRKLLKSYRVTEDNLIKNVQGFKGQSFAERQAQIMERIYSNYEVHVAVVGSHRVYLRKISGTLIKTLLKGKDNECNSFQALVREVLACKVLEPVMGYAHPFYINTAIIAGTKPGNDGSQSNSPRASEGDLERMGARSSATRSSVHSERDGTGTGSDAKVESGQVDEEGSVPKLQPGGSQSLPVGGAAARPRDAASITSAQSDSKVASANVQDIEERLDRWREHKQKELSGGDRRSKGAVLPPFDTPRHMSSTRAERSASNISDSGLGSPARPFTPTTPRPRDDDDDRPERRSRSSSFWATEGDDGVRVVRAAMQYRGRRPTMSPQKGAGSVVLKNQHAHIVESPKPHVRYQLVCQNGKIKWIVEKRYKQFLELHKLLKKSCVDASAADKLSELFPKKTMFTSSLSKKVIAKRKGQLQEYLALCCKMPSVYLSNEFRAFVIPDEKGDGKEDQKDKGHRKKLTAHLYGMVDEVFQLTRHGLDVDRFEHMMLRQLALETRASRKQLSLRQRETRFQAGVAELRSHSLSPTRLHVQMHRRPGSLSTPPHTRSRPRRGAKSRARSKMNRSLSLTTRLPGISSRGPPDGARHGTSDDGTRAPSRQVRRGSLRNSMRFATLSPSHFRTHSASVRLIRGDEETDSHSMGTSSKITTASAHASATDEGPATRRLPLRRGSTRSVMSSGNVSHASMRHHSRTLSRPQRSTTHA